MEPRDALQGVKWDPIFFKKYDWLSLVFLITEENLKQQLNFNKYISKLPDEYLTRIGWFKTHEVSSQKNAEKILD